jgi:biopolymer transport protein TolR
LIVLTVKSGDRVDLNNTPIEMRGLLEELRRYYSVRQDKTIFIRAEAKLAFSKVVEVIDICRGAGIENLAIIPEYIGD